MTPQEYEYLRRQQTENGAPLICKALVPEPGLPWLSGARLDAARLPGLANRLQPFAFHDNSMAPAFPAGCHVAAEPVHAPEQVALGHVYVVCVDGRPLYVGRLAEVLTTPLYALRLTLDNAVDVAPVIFDWQRAEVTLWRITHYLGMQIV